MRSFTSIAVAAGLLGGMLSGDTFGTLEYGFVATVT